MKIAIFVNLNEVNLKPESVNKLLEKSFRNNWRRPALSNYKGETLLYSDLARSIAKMHLAYQHYGIVPGDKVVIISSPSARSRASTPTSPRR